MAPHPAVTLAVYAIVGMPSADGQALPGMPPSFAAPGLAARRLEGQKDGEQCNAVTFRLMPPPAMVGYSECYDQKLASTAHDWSVPGADFEAQADCWCSNNVTETVEEYKCCDHEGLFPWCTLQCEPNCDSDLAARCKEECPSMCFEVSEYLVDEGLCKKCEWSKCWPVLRCLTAWAKTRVTAGELNRTCHEQQFKSSDQLTAYRNCWASAPKHSSHWNLFSSIVHCMCEEDMKSLAKETECCGSITYGGGACDLTCMSNEMCVTQEAQTCIQGCQNACASFNMAPSEDCSNRCLKFDAPCRKYASCRAPLVAGYQCDDGKFPAANTGCCESQRPQGNGTRFSCPSLCEGQRIWRLDGGRSIPWWSRWRPDGEIVIQCSCKGCPSTFSDGYMALRGTIEDTLWDNGQKMLVDIARREGLHYGPNRKMQELMAKRNDEIRLYVGRGKTIHDSKDAVANINGNYIRLISIAAQTHGDDPRSPGKKDEKRRKHKGDGNTKTIFWFAAIAGLCTCCIFGAVAVASKAILRNRRASAAESNNPQVVIGNPVPAAGIRPGEEAIPGVSDGTAITVTAQTKGGRQGNPKEEVQ